MAIIKHIPKVPMVMQMDELECGAASLAMMMGYYKKWIPLEQLREDCGVSRDGVNAGSIMRTAEHYGFKVEGYSFEPEVLWQMDILPCIVHWNFNHFVVLKGIKNGKVYLNDPAEGSIVLTEKEFDEGFTGVCITVEPGEDFAPSGKPKNILKFVVNRLTGTGPAILFVGFTTFVLSLCSVLATGLSRFFMDELLPGNNPELLGGFFLSLVLLALIQISASWISAICSLRISGKFATIGDFTYFWHVLTLPMRFFQHRTAGDIEQRRTYHAQMAEALINTLAPILMNSVMLVVFLTLSFRYSVLLTMVGISSVLINLAVAIHVSKKRVNITRLIMRDKAKLYSATLSGISMIETIKARGLENNFFSRWAGYQAGLNTQNVLFIKLDTVLGRIPSLLAALANSLMLLLGVKLIIDGQFTPGMLFAFQSLGNYVLAPTQSLIAGGQSIQELRTQMERVEDVMDYPRDEMFPEEAERIREKPYRKLSGRIEIRDLTFGYSRLVPPVIEHFNLTMEPGKSVAIVGHSGCGKSTVCNLISGLYRPWSGEILMDDMPIESIDRNELKGSVAMVDQEVLLYRDTIENNIKMWDPSIMDHEMILAAKDAGLHEAIIDRMGGYQYMVAEGGRNLSGGERQRLEIARSLALEPSLLLMDEATSALDAQTEAMVIQAIRNRGISCIVIAHRLSTIRDCDEIIVLDHGKTVERGTHDELIRRGGLYERLVTSD